MLIHCFLCLLVHRHCHRMQKVSSATARYKVARRFSFSCLSSMVSKFFGKKYCFHRYFYYKLDDQQRVEPNGIALVSHRYCFKIAPTCTAVFLHPMAETILAPHKKREDVCLLNNAHHIFSRMAVPSAGCRTSRSFLLLFTPASVSKHCACFAFP